MRGWGSVPKDIDNKEKRDLGFHPEISAAAGLNYVGVKRNSNSRVIFHLKQH
jgi:hypothetical protein